MDCSWFERPATWNILVHVISQKKLREFWVRHPDAETPLRAWLRVAERAIWTRFVDVRAVYASADQYRKFTIFNIGGNKYRLIAAMHFNRRRIYVRHVLTHEEYQRDQWKTG
jgi:mRNA interferase HigB